MSARPPAPLSDPDRSPDAYRRMPVEPDEFPEAVEPLDLTRTKAALAEWDRTAPERKELWRAICDGETFQASVNADEAALLAVRKAFYEDTKDRNSWSHCAVVTISWLRHLVQTQA